MTSPAPAWQVRPHLCNCRSARRCLPRTWRAVATWSVLAVGFPLASTSAAAQQPGVIVGTVARVDAEVIADARVTVIGSALTALTGSDGRFRIDGIQRGELTLEVRRLGYSRARMPLSIASAETLYVHIALVETPIELDEVIVRANAGGSPELRGFYERKARGSGHFFTREDIGDMRARDFTDVLRRVPGFRIQPVSGPFGTGYAVQTGRSSGVAGARTCPVLFYVNGVPFPVAADVTINHFIAPDEVAAVEVYSGSSLIPSQFQSRIHDARCGVVVIWTYDGDRRGRRR